MSTLWQYNTLEMKPKLWGGYDSKVLQDTLTREGLKGCELVQTVAATGLQPMLLIFKKAL